ncbi:MAG: UvrD-helicase domain-containing protein [Cytophagales bacterium]|nr:UvrD-helicase domain-containing protein [Cytophagales bacterium]
MKPGILKTFTLYRSSAGSGKTRTLAKEYLKWALQHRAQYFRHILAVTFTNKATQEMKDRILAYLGAFARGESDSLAEELKKELGMDNQAFQQNCAELLTLILHQYDQFSISTIDAFFQRVIRSFTRESGLIGDYRLEVEQDAVLEEVINNLIDELVDKQELTQWVVEFAKENLENDKAWDVRSILVDFASEIFRDEFKAIEDELMEHTKQPDFFRHLRDELWKVKNAFLKGVSVPATDVLKIWETNQWDPGHFKWGSTSGLTKYFEQFANGKMLKSFELIKDRMRGDFLHAKNWPSKNYPQKTATILQVAETEFIPRIKAINDLYDREYARALTAEIALQNLYVFGLLADIARKLQDYKRENNLMLLADAPKFLNKIIGDSDTPFVYEKVGSFYRHYLIDEFQDTSGFQWNNFLPLLTNGLDEGYPSMVVGDVKQAIYRWRGGDLSLLEKTIEHDIGAGRMDIRKLESNFRSAEKIVVFNNAMFTALAAIASEETESAIAPSVYRDVMQATGAEAGGFVHVSFLEEEGEETWKSSAQKKIPKHLEMLQQRGIPLADIAILVRRNDEGQKIAAMLLEYRNSEQALPDCRYDVVSNESLRIDGASTVNLLLGAMRYLLNPDDATARAQLSYEYARLHEPTRNEADVFAVANQVFFESQLPEKFTREKISLKKLPLFELTETIIDIFDLGRQKGELVYLQAFQDLVLEFYSRERNDLASYLEWWELNKSKEKTSIKLSGEVNAVKILTIHKAKGLEFKYVIIPFCSWNIDHEKFLAPNLWVTSNEQPFSSAGYLPVKYGKVLGRTYFAVPFQEERIRVHLDNLNLLYVALTRAERGLIIMAPHPDTRSNVKSVAGWLYKAIQSSDTLSETWNSATQEFSLGEILHAKEKASQRAGTVELLAYETSRWRDKLVIRQAGNIFFQGMSSDTRGRINYGIHLHAVLSRIKTRDDVAPTLVRLVQEGLVVETERPVLEVELNELLSNPVVARWFELGWDVRNEVPILLPGNTASRIDRLLLKENHAIVIDFKTGEKSKTDQKQVMEYMDILKQMGFTEVEGYLLYTRDKEVLSLHDGKKRVVKKKNESQLGLDF